MILTNAKIFNGREFIKENTVIIKNGIIDALVFRSLKKHPGTWNLEPGTRNSEPGTWNLEPGTRNSGSPHILEPGTWNLEQNILSPGLIDLHTHGCGGYSYLEIDTKEKLELVRKSYAKLGTTSVMFTNTYSENETRHLKIAAKYGKDKYPGARILGVYLESPFISREKRGGIENHYIVDAPAKNYLSIIKKIYKNCPNLRIVAVAPERPDAEKIIKKFRKDGIQVAMGHSAADYNETKKGIEWGIRHTVHFFNAMTSMHHREPGAITALMETPGILGEIIADGNHIHPAVINLAYKVMGRDRIALITDATGLLGVKAGVYERMNFGKVTAKGASFYNKHGVLIGSNVPQLTMCKNIKKWLGVGNAIALQMATLNPAKVVPDMKIGQIKKGYKADFIVVDEALNLKKVFVAGEQV